MNTAADWYRRNYPDAPDYDPRLLDTLAAWKALYNINRYGRWRRDGGIKPCGHGIEVDLKPGFDDFATFDGGGMTTLVLAAHRFCCRVELTTAGRHMVIRIHPRTPGADRMFERHPSLRDLAARATKIAESTAVTS